MERCPNSVISYKLMLHLKKLKKSAIKKNSLKSAASSYLFDLYFSDTILKVPDWESLSKSKIKS
jgi:hypothetical protein